MQAVNPANIATTGNGNLEENGLYAWIGEAIVAQTNHEATRYTHYRNFISKS